MTRERIRQISQRHIDHVKDKSPYLPILDRTLGVILAQAPCLSANLGNVLLEKRLSKVAFKLQGVLNAAEVTGRDCSFIVEEGKPPLKYTDFLADTEKTFVAVFRKIGPLVELHKLEEACLRQGMNRTTFWINLSNSPIISRFARCVYGLRGTEIPPGLAESLVIERKKTRVLGDYGWTQDGKIFLT